MYIVKWLVISIVLINFVDASAQFEDQLEMEFVISNQDLTLVFLVFIVAVVGVCIFLTRDIILRKKTRYDYEDLESKKDKTYEKYHSDWNDDYEEMGSRKNTTKYEEFARDIQNSKLPDYYKILELSKDATPEEIKKQYRELAKKSHPDKTGDEESKIMADINKAYEVLSDVELRSKYDNYLDNL